MRQGCACSTGGLPHCSRGLLPWGHGRAATAGCCPQPPLGGVLMAPPPQPGALCGGCSCRAGSSLGLWMLRAWRGQQGWGDGVCTGSSGRLGLLRAAASSHRSWPRPGCCAQSGTLAPGGQRAIAQECGSHMLPTQHRGVFPLGSAGGSLAESLQLLEERASVSPSFGAGWHPVCSALAARWVPWAALCGGHSGKWGWWAGS